MTNGKAAVTRKEKPRPQKKGEKGAKLPKQPPLWLRRLDLLKAEMKTVRGGRRLSAVCDAVGNHAALVSRLHSPRASGVE